MDFGDKYSIYNTTRTGTYTLKVRELVHSLSESGMLFQNGEPLNNRAFGENDVRLNESSQSPLTVARITLLPVPLRDFCLINVFNGRGAKP